mgnify:CR=1 FL=1|tara:strand:+ start:958 stop:1191 length:234 start_codon:yes stop_codon:yes gene_type:complete
MKKIILSISALALVSFTANKVCNYHLGEAVNNVQDMKEWMMQDLESGKIDPELAEHYMYWLEQTEEHLIELSEENRL